MDLFGEQMCEQQGEAGGRRADTAWGALPLHAHRLSRRWETQTSKSWLGRRGPAISSAAKANSQLLLRKDTVLKLVPHTRHMHNS